MNIKTWKESAMKKSKAKVTRSIRFDADDLKRARQFNINVSIVCRNVLKHLIIIEEEKKKATPRE